MIRAAKEHCAGNSSPDRVRSLPDRHVARPRDRVAGTAATRPVHRRPRESVSRHHPAPSRPLRRPQPPEVGAVASSSGVDLQPATHQPDPRLHPCRRRRRQRRCDHLGDPGHGSHRRYRSSRSQLARNRRRTQCRVPGRRNSSTIFRRCDHPTRWALSSPASPSAPEPRWGGARGVHSLVEKLPVGFLCRPSVLAGSTGANGARLLRIGREHRGTEGVEVQSMKRLRRRESSAEPRRVLTAGTRRKRQACRRS